APFFVEPPPRNLIFENIHNQVIFEQTTNNVVIKEPGGQLISSTALKAAGAGAAAVAIGAALPSFVAKKANVAPGSLFGSQPLGHGQQGKPSVSSPPLHSAPAAIAPAVNPPPGKAVGPVKALAPSL